MLQEKNRVRRTSTSASGRGKSLYVNRSNKPRRNKLILRFVVWAVVIALATLAVFGMFKLVSFCSELMKEDFAFSHTVPDNWVDYDSKSIIKKDYAISIQYPMINDKTNDTIKADAEELFDNLKREIKEFDRGKKENRAVYTVDYSLIQNSDNYISLLYTIHRHNPVREIDDIQYSSKVYDIINGESVGVESIFNENYASAVSDFVIKSFSNNESYSAEVETHLFKDNTAPFIENFSNIGFNGNVMTLYYGAGTIFPSDMGALTLDIPLSRIHSTMNINITGYTPPLFDPELPMVALTFDDGPLTENTTRVLDVLESYGCRATFFIIGNRVESQKDMILRGVELGCEYGNHTWEHANLINLSAEEIASQFNMTDDAMNAIVGKKTTLARAPYANLNDTVYQNVDKPFIGWSIDTLDWKTRDAQAVTAEILDNVKDGDIILMHDLYDSTAAAVEAVVPELLNRGYQLVTVSEMMEAREIKLASGKLYHRAPSKN